jgi:hypothetical protein
VTRTVGGGLPQFPDPSIHPRCKARTSCLYVRFPSRAKTYGRTMYTNQNTALAKQQTPAICRSTGFAHSVPLPGRFGKTHSVDIKTHSTFDEHQIPTQIVDLTFLTLKNRNKRNPPPFPPRSTQSIKSRKKPRNSTYSTKFHFALLHFSFCKSLISHFSRLVFAFHTGIERQHPWAGSNRQRFRKIVLMECVLGVAAMG